MKTTMKKLAAYLLALLLVLQIVPVVADEVVSNIQGSINPDIYRDKMEVKSSASIVLVEESATMTVNEGYENIVWESSDPTIATVDADGKVTGVAPGTVKITGKVGDYSDSVTIQVAEVQKTDSAMMTIVVSADKQKIPYDGLEHSSGFTAECTTDGFDASKVKMVNAAHQISARDCGVYTIEYDPADFIYEGNDNVQFVTSNGWIQIKPADITIQVNDKTIAEGDELEFSATAVGLMDGDVMNLDNLKYSTIELDGTTMIVAENIKPQDIIGNYRVKSVLAGTLTVTPMIETPLYNLAQIGKDNWYRLKKTSFKTVFTSVQEARKVRKNGVLEASDYIAEDYDFTDLVIKLNNKEYVYNCAQNAAAILNGANYYTVKLHDFEAILGKIGGSKGWIIPEGPDRYTDDNKTDSFHRNYDITLVENKLKPAVEQDVYNMANINGGTDYYRLKKGKILAQPLDSYPEVSDLKVGEYSIDPYDFTDLVLVLDGEEYKYSDHIVKDEYYDSYYTVKFERVVSQKRFNENANWYKNPNGWLDGSYEQYGDLPNDYRSFHANYNITTYKGVEAPKKVTITSSWPDGKPAFRGTEITLTAELTGFEEGQYTLQWEYSQDRINWLPKTGETGKTFTYTLDEDTSKYYWRVVANDIE